MLKEAEEKIYEAFARVSDRGKEGSVIASSILGVGGASLLMPKGTHLLWMLRTPVSTAVARRFFS